MRQEVVLAMLAKEPSYGYELRERLRRRSGRSARRSTPARCTSRWPGWRRRAGDLRRSARRTARTARCTS